MKGENHATCGMHHFLDEVKSAIAYNYAPTGYIVLDAMSQYEHYSAVKV